MGAILIVDDDLRLRQSFEKLLTAEGHQVWTAPDGETALNLVQAHSPDMVIMDIRMPGMSGLETFKALHQIEPKLPVIIMTAFGTTETAIETTKLGAFDYVLKPFEIPDILTLIEKALEAGRFMRSRVAMDMPPDEVSGEAIIGKSKPMQEVYKAIGRVAPTDATVLLRGESGTGKELVARALYQHSLRSEKPFLVINCVAIPETLLESELFGYEKGAFTGAVNRKVGKIEQAHGGTILLDEIGDMPFSIQAKILRLLQEKSIERLGGRETIPVDVRIIAATNRDLEGALVEGRFREDLYYRLNIVSMQMPALRDRKEDIPELAEYFLDEFRRERGLPNLVMSEEAVQRMRKYDWPGNIRELRNAIERAVVMGDNKKIRPEDLPIFNSQSCDSGLEVGLTLKEALNRFKKEFITLNLEHTSGNRSQAAKIMGIQRTYLSRLISKYGLR